MFVTFVKDFWQTITTPGVCDPLMNAYAMLLFDIKTLPNACRQYICTQLRETPPDIVLISDLSPLLHGFHQRTPSTWPYICIDRAAVDRWVDGMVYRPNARETLAAEALLKTTIVHEGGHWHYTLRVGPYTEKMMHLRHGLPEDESFRQYQALPAEQREQIIQKHTSSKSLSVPWAPNQGEAGSFSEYRGLGGIMGLDPQSDTLFMRIDAGPLHFLSTDYLNAFRARGVCQFRPAKTADLSQPLPQASCVQGKIQTHPQLPADLPFWPDVDDVCLVAPAHELPEFVGLGFNMQMIPDCPSLEEMLQDRACKHNLSNNATCSQQSTVE